MQNVLIEKPYKFLPPFTFEWPAKLIMYSGIYKRWLKKNEGVMAAEVWNVEKLTASMEAGHSVMLTPNHTRTADPLLMGYLGQAANCTFHGMASWHLFNQGWFNRVMIRLMGGLSVNREGMDRQAIDMAVDLIAQAKRAFLLFPEGTTSRTNDKLMKLMDGTAFIARAAAKKRAKIDGGKVVVHPVAIKYVYEGDIQKACEETLGDIEKRFSWRPQTGLPLVDRLRKLGNALLTLKELEYGVPLSDGPFAERQQQLIEHLLRPLEKEWLTRESRGGIQIRIKNLRMKLFPDISRGVVTAEEKRRRWKQLEDTYLAQQIDSYPKHYVSEFPSVNRILETIERFEEDLTDKARIHGHLRAIIDVLDPIEVSTTRDRAAKEDPMMTELRESLQGRLDELKHESPLYEESA